MATKQEVLSGIAKYGKELGSQRVKNLRISDDESDALTLTTLLLQHPENEYYQSCLDNERRRGAVSERVGLLLRNLQK